MLETFTLKLHRAQVKFKYKYSKSKWDVCKNLLRTDLWKLWAFYSWSVTNETPQKAYHGRHRGPVFKCKKNIQTSKVSSLPATNLYFDLWAVCSEKPSYLLVVNWLKTIDMCFQSVKWKWEFRRLITRAFHRQSNVEEKCFNNSIIICPNRNVAKRQRI